MRPSPLLPPGRDTGHEPAINVPPATLALAAVLVAIYLVMRYLLPVETAEALVDRFAFGPALLLEALAGHGSLADALMRSVTYAFLHADGIHLGVNVAFLIAVASPVERRLGKLRLIALFLAAAVMGALFECFFFASEEMLVLPSVGASGGIFGLMGAALLIGIARPRIDPGLASQLDPLAVAEIEARINRHMRAIVIRMVLALMALNLVIGLLSEVGLIGEYIIGWRAHLGGFLVGLALGLVLRRRERLTLS